MCFAWFIWEHGYKGEPIIKWIHPEDCKRKKFEKKLDNFWIG